MAACAHGPHEIRGCIRNDMVKALADSLPLGTIRFNASVSSIKNTETGAADMHARPSSIKTFVGPFQRRLPALMQCHSCTPSHVVPASAGAKVVLDNGDTYTGKVVVGADGAYSKVRDRANTELLLHC